MAKRFYFLAKLIKGNSIGESRKCLSVLSMRRLRYYLIIYVIHILVGRIIYNWFIMIGADISIILWVAPLVVIAVTVAISIGLKEAYEFLRTKTLKRETD